MQNENESGDIRIPSYSDAEERQDTVNEAEKIFRESKGNFRQSLIDEEFHPSSNLNPDRVQVDAVREANIIFNEQEPPKLINIYDQEFKKLPKITAELSRAKVINTQKHAAEIEWQETVRELTIPPREETGDYPTKYVLSIGQDENGVFYYRTEMRRIDDSGKEILSEAAQLTQRTKDYDNGTFIAAYTIPTQDKIEGGPVYKTTLNEPKQAVDTFTRIYEKVTPSKTQRLRKWVGRKLRFNKVI